MSSITKIWTPVLIKKVIRCLDEKTGLNVASWTIKMNNESCRLGYCDYTKNVICYSNNFLNDPEFRESEAFNLIRHEYAHAYAYIANLEKWIPYKNGAKHHGAHWKYACKMLGMNERRAYGEEKLIPEIDRMTATIRFFAEDVEKIDILNHLKKWNCVPMICKEREELNKALKCRYKKTKFFEIGDECLNLKKGFGTVLDTYPNCLKNVQMVQVEYDHGEIEVLENASLIKMINGIPAV